MDNKECKCGTGFIHDRSECHAGCRCLDCGEIFLYVRTLLNRAGEARCPFCDDTNLVTWDNEGDANEMYPGGCQCKGLLNSPSCNYCEWLLLEPEETFLD